MVTGDYGVEEWRSTLNKDCWQNMKNLYIPLILSAALTLACGAMTAPLALPTAEPSITPAVIVITEVVTSMPKVTPCGIVTAGRLNLRASADYRSPADGAGLVKGDVVEIVATVGDWYEVTTADGRTGYARAEYIYTNRC